MVEMASLTVYINYDLHFSNANVATATRPQLACSATSLVRQVAATGGARCSKYLLRRPLLSPVVTAVRVPLPLLCAAPQHTPLHTPPVRCELVAVLLAVAAAHTVRRAGRRPGVRSKPTSAIG